MTHIRPSLISGVVRDGLHFEAVGADVPKPPEDIFFFHPPFSVILIFIWTNMITHLTTCFRIVKYFKIEIVQPAILVQKCAFTVLNTCLWPRSEGVILNWGPLLEISSNVFGIWYQNAGFKIWREKLLAKTLTKTFFYHSQKNVWEYRNKLPEKYFIKFSHFTRLFTYIQVIFKSFSLQN